MKDKLSIPLPQGWHTFMDMEKGMILLYDPAKFNLSLGVMNVLFPHYESEINPPAGRIDEVKK